MWTKSEWLERERHAVNAFQAVARKLGKTHTLVKLMGTLAWGRHPFERGPSDQSKEHIIRAAAGLEGMYHVLNLWARDHDQKAQRVLIDEWHKK